MKNAIISKTKETQKDKETGERMKDWSVIYENTHLWRIMEKKLAGVIEVLKWQKLIKTQPKYRDW